MPNIRGRITHLVTYEEEGRTDWALALSKICWFLICLLMPFSIYRFLKDLFGSAIGVGGIFLLLILVRLQGPLNLVLLDELLGRIFPELRTAYRFGRTTVYDFRVEQESGAQISCILRGELQGATPMQGDWVTLQGVYRLGTLRVTSGRNEVIGAIFLPRPNYSGWILLVTGSALILFILYLKGVFDAYLYPWVADWVEYLLNIE